jgi:6-phosphogluconolactonase (cycloisomerase 2 family)
MIRHFSYKVAVRLALFRVLCSWLSLGVCGCGQSSQTTTPPPPNASPTLSALSPVSARVGGSTFTLTVTGTGFVPTSVVQWNGSNRPTTFVSNTQITAQISANDIAALGKATVTVFTPAPGGGTSTSLAFNVFPLTRFAYATASGSARIFTLAADPASGRLLYTGYALAESSNPSSVALHSSGRFAYVLNQQTSGSVSMFRVDTSDGVLTLIAPAMRAGDTPSAIALDPLGRFAYVANLNSGTISMYAIDAATGLLTPIGTGTVAAGAQPDSIALDPLGKFVFVANRGSSDVSMFSVNATGGALSPIGAGTVTSGGSNPSAVVVDPSGRFAYVAHADGTVAMLKIDAVTGALAAGSGASAGKSPSSIAIDPTGRFAYVGNFGSNDVSAFAINNSTGALTSLGATIAAGQGPQTVLVDPSGNFVYVGNGNDTQVSIYSMNGSTGALTQVNALPARGNPASLALAQGTSAVTRTGKFLYVVNDAVAMDGTGGEVWMYTVDPSSGALTSTNPPFVAASPGSALAIAADPFGRFVYVALNKCCSGSHPPGFPSAIAMFTVDATTGLLTPTTPATIAPGNSSSLIGAITVDPTGRFVYVPDDGDNEILEYAITTPSGALTPIGSAAAGPNLNTETVAVEPSGTFLYVTSLTQGVFMFTINPATGALTPTNPPNVLAATQPAETAVDPTGKFAYVVNNGPPFNTSVVSMYTIDSSTGVLNSTGTVAAGVNPSAVAVNPSGRFAYVINSNMTLLYSIDGSTGLLSPLGSAGAGTPVAITFDPSGKFAYGLTPGNVLTFTIDPRTGILSQAGSASGPTHGAGLAIIGTTQ